MSTSTNRWLRFRRSREQPFASLSPLGVDLASPVDSKKRLVLPWSLQASHQRKLEKEGKRYAFGSYKYTAQDLYDRGVLLSIDQFSPKQFDKVTLTISSDEVGVFEVSAAYMGVKVETVELKLDELLEAQFVSAESQPLVERRALTCPIVHRRPSKLFLLGA